MSSNMSPDTSNARTTLRWLGGWLPWMGLLVVTGIAAVLVIQFIVRPAYDDPDSRMYTSRLGYVAMKRRRNEPLSVTTCYPQTRTITENFVGEGLVRSTPVLVSIVPASRIEEVFVSDGDYVTAGQTLAKLDTSQAELRIEAARAVHEIAVAELERTKIGSSYLMEKERPEQDAIRLRSVQEKIKVQAELTEMHEKLAQNRDLSRADLLKLRLRNIDTLAELREAEVALKQSLKGREQSIRIATATVREAELAIEQRLLELKDHEIVAPTDGTIERRLVQEGEYNQAPGKPAFLLASGIWFEAYFDQTVFGKIATGAEAKINLEALAGTELAGTVAAVYPFVSFSAGGPESTRPIRPSGTGSPEWPSTFSIRVELNEKNDSVAAGLSGLAKLTREREVLAIPTEAIHSRSSTKAIVLLPNGDEFVQREIIVGASSDGWTEVQGGLERTEPLISQGHLDLRPGNKILVEPMQPALLAKQESS